MSYRFPRRPLSRLTLGLGLCLMSSQLAVGAAPPPPLIPRDILFGNPEKAQAQISPDGKRLAYIAPDDKNVLQVWVRTLGGEKDDARVVTADKKRGIRRYLWAEDNRTLLYLQDQDGDENFHVYGVDLTSNNVRDYTPIQGVRAEIVATAPDRPDDVLVSLNARDRRLFDVYRLDLKTGALVLDTENPGDVAGFAADSKLQVRAAQVVTPEGGTELRVRDDVNSGWRTWLKVGPDEILNAVDFAGDGRSLTLQSSIGSDTARIVQRNLASGQETVLASSTEADAGPPMIHPRTHAVEAVPFSPDRTRWMIVDPAVKGDFEAIGQLFEGDFQVVSRDDRDRTWIVAFTSDQGPVRYYVWDRDARKSTFLFTTTPKLEGLQLAKMEPVTIPARDGLKLYAYLTLPVGVEPKDLPMVLLVHGGPWARDSWGYNPMAQWFANRGYACLMVNYRGSTGYGKRFLHAADKQWGLTMHDDLIDTVNWAVKKGYANPKKVAIFGGSYGGYAALAGVTFTPDFFACAVDIVGPSNLKTLIASIPPYWKPMRALFDSRMGNVDDPKDAELIKNASPLFKADRIVRPLLIGQGANDPRVKQAESEQIVEAIAKTGGKVTYVLYPDEGHGFARPENRIDFNARAEVFLAEHLGGRYEPLSGEKIPGSTAVVRQVAP